MIMVLHRSSDLTALEQKAYDYHLSFLKFEVKRIYFPGYSLSWAWQNHFGMMEPLLIFIIIINAHKSVKNK